MVLVVMEGREGGDCDAMPRGHLSKHPTALEIAASSISISPVLQQEYEQTNPSYNTRVRNSAYTSLYAPTPPFDDDETPSFSTNPAPIFRGAGRGRSSTMSILDPPSSSALPPYRAVPRNSNSADGRNSRTDSPFQAPTVATATSSSSTSIAATPPPSTPARRPPPTFKMGNPPSHNKHEDFLEQRRAEAAARYLRPDDQNMGAIYKRSLQVEFAVGRAKERITQLGLKCPSRKHHGKGCMANITRQIQIIKDNPFWGLWGEQLKEIEGSFGSAVMITFAFLRWVFLLNVCLSVLWIGAIVIPFFLHPPSSYQWTGIKQYFQANGLEKTWILFGGYFYKSEQNGWYRTDYMYPCTIAVTFLISLVAILAT